MNANDLADAEGECHVNRTVVSRAVRGARDMSTHLEVLLHDGEENRAHKTLQVFSKVLGNVPSTLRDQQEQRVGVPPPTLDLGMPKKPSPAASPGSRRVNLSAVYQQLSSGKDPSAIPELSGPIVPPRRRHTVEQARERRDADDIRNFRHHPPPPGRVDYAALHKQQAILVQERADSETVYKELLERYHAYTDAIMEGLHTSDKCVFPPASPEPLEGSGNSHTRRRSTPLHLR